MQKAQSLKEICSTLSVVDYLDYREYLAALCAKIKKIRGKYSYVKFSVELGLGEGNVSYLIIKGKRKLTRHTARKVVLALGLTGNDRKYFTRLVRFSNAKKFADRDEFLARMVRFKERTFRDIDSKDQLEFLSAWHHVIVFEALAINKCAENPAKIPELMRIPLSAEEVEASLQLLVRLGYIARDTETGKAKRLVNDLVTSDEVSHVGAVMFHQKMIELSKESITRVEHTEREINSVTIAVSEEVAVEIKDAVRKFSDYILLMSEKSIDKTKIMQVNVQMFPLTR